MTTIAFVDDYAPFRDALATLLEALPNGFKVHLYDDGQDFVSRFPNENYSPAVVLMDVRMPKMNGYDTTAWIKKNYPTIPVLVFSDVTQTDAILALTKCGANGHCSKVNSYGNPPVRLLEAMTSVMQGKLYYDNLEMYEFVKERLAMPKKQLQEGIGCLTERQQEVIRYISLHKTYEENARKLNISSDAYHSRIGTILKKLRLKSSKELYDWAVVRGLKEN